MKFFSNIVFPITVERCYLNPRKKKKKLARTFLKPLRVKIGPILETYENETFKASRFNIHCFSSFCRVHETFFHGVWKNKKTWSTHLALKVNFF